MLITKEYEIRPKNQTFLEIHVIDIGYYYFQDAFPKNVPFYVKNSADLKITPKCFILLLVHNDLLFFNHRLIQRIFFTDDNHPSNGSYFLTGKFLVNSTLFYLT